MFKDFCE
jgi:hypothetical protein